MLGNGESIGAPPHNAGGEANARDPQVTASACQDGARMLENETQLRGLRMVRGGGNHRERSQEACMKRIGSLTLAALLGVAVWYAGPALRAAQQQAFAQEINAIAQSDGAYLLSYYDTSTAFGKSEGGYGGAGHSGGSGDALLRIVNAGNYETGAGAGIGDVCANIYVFNDVQEMQECCHCDLSANSLMTFSVISDLTANPLISNESTEAGVIKIIGVNPLSQGPSPLQSSCGIAAGPVAEGLHAWLNHTETMASNQPGFTPPWGFVTSTSVEEFAHSELDAGELAQLNSECAYIWAHGSRHGICTCGLGD